VPERSTGAVCPVEEIGHGTRSGKVVMRKVGIQLVRRMVSNGHGCFDVPISFGRRPDWTAIHRALDPLSLSRIDASVNELHVRGMIHDPTYGTTVGSVQRIECFTVLLETLVKHLKLKDVIASFIRPSMTPGSLRLPSHTPLVVWSTSNVIG
jgi:hypothetical protein